MSLPEISLLILRIPRSSALVPVSTSTRTWDTPTLAAPGLALTSTCGGKASTRPALKICTLSDDEVSRSLAGNIMLEREYA